MTRDTERTFGRRDVLGLLGTAGIASLAGCGGGGDGTPTQAPEKPGPFTNTPEADDEPNPKVRRGIQFDRIRDAVSDLGWDPNGEEPIDDSLDQHLREGTLIEVPPGDYLVERRHDVEGVSRWGILGTGRSRRDVQFTIPAGRSFRWIMVDGGRDILVENFTMQQGRKFDRSIGMGFLVDDNLKLFNVEKAGSNPREDSESGAENGIVVQVMTPDGVAEVNTFVRKGPQDMAHYPGNSITVFTGRSHLGTLYYRNLHIENGGEHGIYASKAQGDVRVEGGLFKNNYGDGVRIAGEGSWVKGATVVIDDTDRTPGNRGKWRQARGIHMQSGKYGLTGGLVEDCTVIARSSPRTEALLKIEHNQGAATVRNCRFFNNTSYPTIVVDEPATGPQRPTKPWDMTFENIQISGQASNTVGLLLQGRPGSRLSNVTIDLPGIGVDGIVLDDSAGTIVDGVSVLTGGYPLRVSSKVGTSECLATLKNIERLQSALLTDVDTRQLGSSLSGTTCLGGSDSMPNALAVIGATEDQLYGTVLDPR
ncbi:right-handed parallel beta-helix repeat-containing protein [Halogeometricum limi]|uniref:Right handed beta helix region n=1 Tax=Halogeometricum limi TaxID=555875 RepID=A0A1I6IJS5_9EURY|nr:right-handed parallel beta-helix repeat-containing protein [Halogeometricum limi]SFR66550.1 hypothetical protein SAMN04488124_3258 [Halogeometricum limi]